MFSWLFPSAAVILVTDEVPDMSLLRAPLAVLRCALPRRAAGLMPQVAVTNVCGPTGAAASPTTSFAPVATPSILGQGSSVLDLWAACGSAYRLSPATGAWVGAGRPALCGLAAAGCCVQGKHMHMPL